MIYLITVSNTDGESIPVIPDDAELSPELIEALKNNSLSPEDLEVVKDEETGKNIVRSRSQMSAAMGGVKEGHIYVPVAKSMYTLDCLNIFVYGDSVPCNYSFIFTFKLSFIF